MRIDRGSTHIGGGGGSDSSPSSQTPGPTRSPYEQTDAC